MALPRLTPAQRMARKTEKEQQLLHLLASGEGWIDTVNSALLWSLSSDAAATTLRAMCRDHLLVREEIATGPRTVYPIYGITPDGIAACSSAAIDAAEHQLGRLQPTGMPHSLAVQRVRIAAVAAGWSTWRAGRLLYRAGLPVVPDAVAVDLRGKVTAIELERNVKSLKRRREVISGHVLAMAAGKWHRVLYICDARADARRLQALYMSLDELKTPGGRTPMEDVHRARFQFVNLSTFLQSPAEDYR